MQMTARCLILGIIHSLSCGGQFQRRVPLTYTAACRDSIAGPTDETDRMLPEQKLDALISPATRRWRPSLRRRCRPETFVKLSREFAELGPIVEAIKDYRAVVAEIDGLDAMLADPATDAEMRTMAAPRSPRSKQSAPRSSRRSSSRSCPRTPWTSAT